MRRSAADDYAPRVGRSSPTPIADYWRGLGIRFDNDEAAVPEPAPVVLVPAQPPQPQAGRSGLSRLFSSLSRRKRPASPAQRDGRFVSRPTLSRPGIVVSPPLPDISPFPSTASRTGAAAGPPSSLKYQRSLGSLSYRAGPHREESPPRPRQAPPVPQVPRSAPPQQTAFTDVPFSRPAPFGRGTTALPRCEPSMGPPPRPMSNAPRPVSNAMPAETPFAGAAALKGLGLDFKPADPLAKGSRMSSATLAYLANSPPKESTARFDAIMETEEEERLFGELSPPKKLMVVNPTSPDEAPSSEDEASPQLKPFERPLPPPPRPHRRSPNLDRRTPSPRPRSTGSQPGSRPNSTSQRNSRHRPHGSVTEEEEAAAGDVDEYRARMRSGTSRRSISPRIGQQEASRPEVPLALPTSFSKIRLPSFRFSRSGVTLDDIMARYDNHMASQSPTPPTASPASAPRSDFARGTTTPSPTFVPVAASPAASTSGVRSSVGAASPHVDKVSPRPRVQSLLASVHLDALSLSPMLATSPRPGSSFSVPVTVVEEEEEDDGPAVVVLPPTPVVAPAAELTPAPAAEQAPPRPLSPSSSSSSVPNSSGFSVSASQTSLTSFAGTELSCEEAIDSMLDELARPHSPPDLLITHCDDDDEATSSSGERTPTPSSVQKSFSVYQDSALASLARAAEEEGSSPLAAARTAGPSASTGSVRWSVDSKYSSSSSVYGGADWDDLSGSGGEEEAVLQRKRSVRISRVGATASAKTVVVSAGRPHAPVDAPTRYHSRPLSIVEEEREEANDDDDDKTVEAVHVVDSPSKSPSKRQSVRNSVVFASKRVSVRKSAMLSPEDALATDKLVRELLRRRSAFVCGRFDDVEDGEEDEEEESVSGSEDEGVVLFGERIKVAVPDTDDDSASVVSFGLAY